MGFQVEFTSSREIMDVEDITLNVAPIDRRNVTKPGDNDPVHIWSKFCVGRVSMRGINIAAAPTQLLPRLKTGNTVGVKIRLANGRIYSGSVGIDGSTERGKPTNPLLDLEGTFTGEIAEANAKALSNRTLGMRLDLHEGNTYTLAYQDKRGDSAVRPFYTDGLTDNNTAIPGAIAAAVAEAGTGTANANQHKHPYDSTLPIHTGTGQRFDSTSVIGVLHYAHGPRSCVPAAPTVTIGHKERRRRVTLNFDGPEGNEVCQALAEEQGITYIRTLKVRLPVPVVRVPCIWEGPAMPQQPACAGFTNENTYSLFGWQFNPHELMCEGIDFSPYEDRDGIYYRGSLIFTYQKGGWRAGRLICVRMVQVDPEGTQTVGGYTLQTGFQQFYEYDTTVFPPLATLCGHCYGDSVDLIGDGLSRGQVA